MFLRIAILLITTLISVSLSAQVDPNDCSAAIGVCNSGSLNNNSNGPGEDDFLPAGNHKGCLTDKEHQSAWYRFCTKSAGTMEFTITPNSGSGEDYDFAVFGPDKGCDQLGSPIRCSYASGNCEFCPSTGLGNGETDFSEGGFDGNGFVAPIEVQEGECYYLLVDNFTASSAGFTIDWRELNGAELSCCFMTINASGPSQKCYGAEFFINVDYTFSKGIPQINWSALHPDIEFLTSPNDQRPQVKVPADFTEDSVQFVVNVIEDLCDLTDTITVYLDAAPGVAINVEDTTVCPGECVEFEIASDDAVVNYNWSTGAKSSKITVCPTEPTSVSATIKTVAGCEATVNAQINIVDGGGIVVSGDSVSCAAECVTLSATGATSYSWSTGESSSSITVCPTENTTYSVSGTSTSGCNLVTDFEVQTRDLPNASAGSDRGVCHGDDEVISASGGQAYLWSTGETTSSIQKNITEDQTYTVTATDNFGCSAEATVQISALALPVFSAGDDQLICAGDCVDLTATGHNNNTYGWSNGATGSTTNVCPQVETTYSVTAVDENNCTSTEQVKVGFHENPAAKIEGDSVVCFGSCATLTAFGGSSYLWSDGSTGNTLEVCPENNASYQVTITDANGCGTVKVHHIRVSELLDPIDPSIYQICAGDAETLTANIEASSVQWSTGESTNSIEIAPANDAVYTVTVTNSDGCISSEEIQVTVQQLPNYSKSNDTVICFNENVELILEAENGSSVQWQDDGSQSFTRIVQPTVDTYFSFVLTLNGCHIEDSIQVMVKQPPTLSVSNDTSICPNSPVQLSVSGTNHYEWSTGATTSQILVQTATSTTYVVTGTDAYGCSAAESILVDIYGAANASLGDDDTICSASTKTLEATGGSTYIWSTGATSSSIDVAPINDTMYSVTVTDDNGCSDSDSISIITTQPPTLEVEQRFEYCKNECDTITVVSNAQTFNWSHHTSNSNSVVSCESESQQYVVSALLGSCATHDTIDVVVNQLPFVSIGADATTICVKDTVTLTGQGALTYAWSTGDSDQSIRKTPQSNQAYFVTGTDANGCQANAAQTIVVKEPIPLDIDAVDAEICGNEVQLSVSNSMSNGRWIGIGGQHSFNPSAQSDRVTVTVSEYGQYHFIWTETHDFCERTDTVSVLMSEQPVADAGFPTSACDTAVALMANPSVGEGTWTLIDPTGVPFRIVDDNDPNTVFAAQEFARYTLRWTERNNGCTSIDQVEVELQEKPMPYIGEDTIFCGMQGEMGIQRASRSVVASDWTQVHGPGNLSFSTPNQSETGITASREGEYILRYEEDNGNCTNFDDVVVRFKSRPTVQINPSNPEVCQNDTISLTASGAFSCEWLRPIRSSESTIQTITDSTRYFVVQGKDEMGCTSVDSILVDVLKAPSVSIEMDEKICLNDAFDMFAFVEPGTAPFIQSIQWFGDTAALDDPNKLRAYFNSESLSVGNSYNLGVQVQDQLGCVDQTEVNFTIVGLPIADAGGDKIACAEALISFEPDTSTVQDARPYQYRWLSQSGFFDTTKAEFDFRFPDSDVVELIVTDNNECKNMDQIRVRTRPLPEVTAPLFDTLCPDQDYIVETMSDPDYTYKWSTGATTPFINVNIKGAEIHRLTVTNQFGCEVVQDVVLEDAHPEFEIEASEDIVEHGTEVQMEAVMTSEWANLDWGELTWSPLDKIDFVDESAKYISTKVFRDQEFFVTLTSKDGKCSFTQSILINAIEPPIGAIATSGFTPNGDGVNDKFKIVVDEFITLKSAILFNRWGKKVYEYPNHLNSLEWDGHIDGELQPGGTYVFQIITHDQITGENKEYGGSVLMIR